MRINGFIREATMIAMMYVMKEVKGEKADCILGEQGLTRMTI